MFACGGGNICYNILMNKIVEVLKKYMYVISVFIGISIILGVTYSNFIVTSNNHKAAEMYIGSLKYSIEINGNNINTLSIPTGSTLVTIKVNNLNPVDTYYKLLYSKNTNINISYYEKYQNIEYSSPNASLNAATTNTIKLKIVNNSTETQNLIFKVSGGYITNSLSDIKLISDYVEITNVVVDNTVYCKTDTTLTQGTEYVNGQYTYRYMQEGKYVSSSLGWNNITDNGWGVQLTDKTSTAAVTTEVCSYINDIPVISMAYMYYNSKATFIDLSKVNTSNVINMNYMFESSQATSLDLSNFDTSKVKNMSYMFEKSQALTLDLSNFNTENVTSMTSMFKGSKATSIDVSKFNTSNVTNMMWMFIDTLPTKIDVSNFNTKNVTNMYGMFQNSKAELIDVSNFDTGNVTTMYQMFNNSKATTIKGLNNFNTSNVTNMSAMFANSNATLLDVSSFNTGKVANMYQMFYNSKSTILDVSNFDTGKTTDMRDMFNTTIISTLDVSSFNTSLVTHMGGMFANNSNLKTIYASDKFNVGNVTSSTNMFKGCTNLMGGEGTRYNSSYVDKTYAVIDEGTTNPGYFTDSIDKDLPSPNSFSTDSWKTIIKAVRENDISKYNVGDTKIIDANTYGTHTLRIANTSTPSECSTTGYSQTACGFVLEFVDSITESSMNSSEINTGGWPSSSLRTIMNNDIFNQLPPALQKGIVSTTVVSGHGSGDDNNFTSSDKLYLLSPKEIYTNYANVTDSAKNLTRTLDYYTLKNVTITNYAEAVKKNKDGTKDDWWWLRTASSSNKVGFVYIQSNGGWSTTYADDAKGVSPAFRIG